MSGEKNLSANIQRLAEALEDSPDRWFDSPSGWLLKPNYDRYWLGTLDTRFDTYCFISQKRTAEIIYR